MTKTPISARNVAPPEEAPSIRLTDSPHAPVVFFDSSPNAGMIGGMFHLTLSAYKTLIQKDGTSSPEMMVVAHLRCTPDAAAKLKDKIEKALLYNAKTSGDPN